MHRKRWQIINLIFFLVLFGANLFIYFNRNNGYAYVGEASYHQLYCNPEEPVIHTINYQNDSAFIYVKGSESAWRENQSKPYQSIVPIQLKNGKNLYYLESRKGKKLTLGLNFTPSEEYQKHKRKRDDVLELYYSSVPVTNEDLYPLNDWLYIDERATQLEKIKGLALIGSRMHIGAADKTEIKVLKTAEYILQNLDAKRGIPDQVMDSLSPLQRLNTAIAGRSSVWCGDFASIFSFFMNLEGIPVRLVALEGQAGEALKAGHVFNEVYLKELRQWALVDLTAKVLLVKNEKGEFLNAQEVFIAHKVCPSQLQVATFKGQLLESAPYEQVKGFYDYYFQSNSHFVYYMRTQFMKGSFSPFQKINRYLFQAPTFMVYDQAERCDNRRFYVKQSFAFGMVLFLLYWLIASLLTRKKL